MAWLCVGNSAPLAAHTSGNTGTAPGRRNRPVRTPHSKNAKATIGTTKTRCCNTSTSRGLSKKPICHLPQRPCFGVRAHEQERGQPQEHRRPMPRPPHPRPVQQGQAPDQRDEQPGPVVVVLRPRDVRGVARRQLPCPRREGGRGPARPRGPSAIAARGRPARRGRATPGAADARRYARRSRRASRGLVAGPPKAARRRGPRRPAPRRRARRRAGSGMCAKRVPPPVRRPLWSERRAQAASKGLARPSGGRGHLAPARPGVHDPRP